MNVNPVAYRHRTDTGITAEVIRELVAVFYARVRKDAVLGPVFDEIIGDGWDAHLEKVAAFWRYTTRIDRAYRARDFMPAHVRHRQIQASLLPRWLSLFRQTAREVCPQEAADHLIDIAERMATSIEISLGRRG
jgi:hemoglobin